MTLKIVSENGQPGRSTAEDKKVKDAQPVCLAEFHPNNCPVALI